MTQKNKPLLLLILDGVGVAEKSEGNAFELANKPTYDFIVEKYPSVLMNASEEFVGLPKGQFGNSEVGHLNIGAGRVIEQSLVEINNSIKDGSIKDNNVLLKAIKHAKDNNSRVNLIGLLSTGGVHSLADHFISIYKICKEHGVEINNHIFTDGRDTGEFESTKEIERLLNEGATISSISGRYYSMDRDKKWDRIQLALDVINDRKGREVADPIEYINQCHERKESDEFIKPVFIAGTNKLEDNDSVIFLNFRPDRARQLSHCLVGSNVDITKYDYEPTIKNTNLYFCSTKPYAGIEQEVMFPNKTLKNLLGDVIEANGLTQVRAAETEKYPHVTFFFDGGKEVEKEHETRILVQSPKVPTYDLAPEMSCEELTKKILETNDKDVYIINFAQTDMVGHTGNIPAVVRSVEIADKMLDKLYKEFVVEQEGTMLIVADHGNCEVMLNEDGTSCTTHTTNQVRLIITDESIEFNEKLIAKLADIAPTMLKILKIERPVEMTGNSLIK